MSFEQFVSIMFSLGIPENRCKHDVDAGIYIAHAGELTITGNSISTKLTVYNKRTRARFMTEAMA